jgi:hypothetical protein
MKYVHLTYNFVTAKPKVVPIVLGAVRRLAIICFRALNQNLGGRRFEDDRQREAVLTQRHLKQDAD